MEIETDTAQDQLAAKKKVTIIGGLVNLVLSALKIVFGWFGQSHALVADGIHSLSDLLTDVLVYVAAEQGAKEADEKHPYGHARFETLATVALGGVLVAVAGAIVWDAITGIFSDQALAKPSWIVLVIAGVSIICKEGLFRLTLDVANKTNSPLMKANAWHHRSDAVSSLVVLIGVAIEILGYHYFDAIAALIVGLMVAKIGLSLINEAGKELVDTAIEPELLEQVKKTILKVHGVRALHFLRTRQMAGQVLVDVHILVAPTISVSEGHLITEKVSQVLQGTFERVSEVMVHIDSEDDEVSSPSLDLPLRDELLKMLDEAWADLAEKEQIKNVNLHYLEGKVFVEIELPLMLLSSHKEVEQLIQAYESKGSAIDEVDSVKVLFG